MLMDPRAGPLISSTARLAQGAEAGVAQVDLHWQWEGEFQLQGPLGGGATSGCAHDPGVVLQSK